MSESPEDLQRIGQSIDEVLAGECHSRALHALYDGHAEMQQALWRRAVELGWLGLGLPVELGGLGLGAHGLTVLFRSLGSRAAPGPFIPTLVGAHWLAQWTEPSLAASICARVLAGDATIALAARLGDAAMPLAGGRLEGVSGRLLGAEDAGFAIVRVVCGSDTGFALIELNGIEREDFPLWDRTRTMFSLTCDGVQPVAIVWDPDGMAAAHLVSLAGLVIAADSLGGARSIAEQTVEFMKTRRQFDKPIASFQALKHRAADMVISIEIAVQVLDQATESLGTGKAALTAIWTALAKAHADETFCAVADDCLQLHGAAGFSWEYDPHIFLKRALLNEALFSNKQQSRDRAAVALATATRLGQRVTDIAA